MVDGAKLNQLMAKLWATSVALLFVRLGACVTSSA